MLIVKTKIRSSKLHGIGIFADQDIPKGTVVWEFNSSIDKIYTERDIKSLPPLSRQMIKHYGWKSVEGNMVLCGDDARFFNHSVDANCSELNDVTIAERNIKRGEELTENYCQFDNAWKDKHIILTPEEKELLAKRGLLTDTDKLVFPRKVKQL